MAARRESRPTGNLPETCRELWQNHAGADGRRVRKMPVPAAEPLKNMVFLCASVPRWLKTGWLKIVQKKVKKKLTPLATSARFDLHTVKQQHTTTLQK
jgi:hypothetical protein